MPESRPFSSLRPSNFDDPPATSDNSTPYPDRQVRLRRALRNTNDLARDVPPRPGYSPAVDSPRNTSMSLLRRSRHRLGASSQHENASDSTAEESGGRSAKRRRLNDSPPAVKKPIKYGHYGQVVPGRLQMEIISNDGGEHQDPRNPGIFLGADNILKLDKSVFCSERTSAGIILRHTDETCFSLEKLHIVGPEHGFTAPVRDGEIYVAMDIKDLQKYQDPPRPIHARLSGIHQQPYNRYRGIQASPEQLNLFDALRDPAIANGSGSRSLSPFPHDEPDDTTDAEPYYGADYLGQIEPEAHCDFPSPPTNALQNAGTSFTLMDIDEVSGPEDDSPQEVLDYRLQRLRRMSRRHDMDDWEPTGPRWSYSRADGTVMQRNASRGEGHVQIPAHPRAGYRPGVHPRHAAEQSGSLPQSEPSNRNRTQRPKVPQPAADDPNVQAAKFTIKRGKSRVAVRFDPPVSGRYILLKLWAGSSNVDVQSVIAKGFAGPRFFPAMELL